MRRTERGMARTGEREVIRQAVGTGLVGSKSEPGAWHTVEGYRCDCKGYEYHNRCAHVDALIDAEIRAGVRGELPPTQAARVVIVFVDPPRSDCQTCGKPVVAIGADACYRHHRY